MFGEEAVKSVFDFGGKIIDKVFPDPVKAAEARLKLAELNQRGELAELDADMRIMLGQMDINKEEAKSPSLFIAGGRPAVMWVCVCGLAMQYIIGPLFNWTAVILGKPLVFPGLDMATLLPLLFGMLGLGGFRSFDKWKGTDTKEIGASRPPAKG